MTSVYDLMTGAFRSSIYICVCIYILHIFLINVFWRKHVLYWHYTGSSLVAQRVNNLPEDARDLGSIPGSGRSPREGNG